MSDKPVAGNTGEQAMPDKCPMCGSQIPEVRLCLKCKTQHGMILNSNRGHDKLACTHPWHRTESPKPPQVSRAMYNKSDRKSSEEIFGTPASALEASDTPQTVVGAGDSGGALESPKPGTGTPPGPTMADIAELEGIISELRGQLDRANAAYVSPPIWARRQTLKGIAERLQSMADFAYDSLRPKIDHAHKLDQLRTMLVAEKQRIEALPQSPESGTPKCSFCGVEMIPRCPACGIGAESGTPPTEEAPNCPGGGKWGSCRDGRDPELCKDCERKTIRARQSPSAPAIKFHDWYARSEFPPTSLPIPIPQVIRIAEAFAAYVVGQSPSAKEPDWHAFYTDSETKRLHEQEVREAAEAEVLQLSRKNELLIQTIEAQRAKVLRLREALTRMLRHFSDEDGGLCIECGEVTGTGKSCDTCYVLSQAEAALQPSTEKK